MDEGALTLLPWTDGSRCDRSACGTWRRGKPLEKGVDVQTHHSHGMIGRPLCRSAPSRAVPRLATNKRRCRIR